MIKRWLSKYFVTVFVLATLMGVFHQHCDLQTHENCQVCLVTSNIADGDTPIQRVYLRELSKLFYALEVNFTILYASEVYNPINSRAPPQHS